MVNIVSNWVDERLDMMVEGTKDIVGGTLNWGVENVAGEKQGTNQEKAGIWGTIAGTAKNTWRGVEDIVGKNPETQGIFFAREAYLNPFRIARAAYGGAVRTTTEFVSDSVGTVIGTQHGKGVEKVLKGVGKIGGGWALGNINKELTRQRTP